MRMELHRKRRDSGSRVGRLFVLPLGAWVVAVFGTALALAFAIGTAAAGPSPTLPVINVGQPTTVPLNPSPTGPNVIQATAATPRAVAAGKIALRESQTFQQLLGGISYRVISSTPWANGDGTAMLGVRLQLQLRTPLTATTGLPGVHFSSDGSRYTQVRTPARVSNATSLAVLVDLKSNRVVSVMPPDSTVSRTNSTPKFHISPGARDTMDRG